MVSNLRYLWVYSASNAWYEAWHQRLIQSRRSAGYTIDSFCITPQALQFQWFHFPELDARWRAHDRQLLAVYAQLAKKIQQADVLILYNGANMHPEFISQFKHIVKVYTAGDDPESTDILTKPVAKYFDIHLVNNIACVSMYKSWGLGHVHFWPLGSLTFAQDINSEMILSQTRDIPLLYVGGNDVLKRQRLTILQNSFPQSQVYGRGWPKGSLSYADMWSLYGRTVIGWNIHNSTGPINFRTYDLPAYGILQLCDNKSHLGSIYELDQEVVGFDSIAECIELTQYYLAHPEQRQKIAQAGHLRWKKDYHPDALWEKLVRIVEHYTQVQTGIALQQQSRSADFIFVTAPYSLKSQVYCLYATLRRTIGRMLRYCRRTIQKK